MKDLVKTRVRSSRKDPLSTTLSARELRKLPEKERGKILRAAARKAVKDYEPGGSLWVK
jgi:hypothetical protein